MPIYEYHCNACDHEFEVIQKITDKPIRKCEKCGKLKAKRMISQSSFILKGSGWYVTDYAGKNPSNGNQPHQGDDKPSKSDQASSKSDDKPAKTEEKASGSSNKNSEAPPPQKAANG